MDQKVASKINDLLAMGCLQPDDSKFDFFKRIVCPAVVNEWITPNGLNSHSFKCPFSSCAVLVSRSIILERHLREKHYDQIPLGVFGKLKEYNCIPCGHVFKRLEHLNIHKEGRKHLKNLINQGIATREQHLKWESICAAKKAILQQQQHNYEKLTQEQNPSNSKLIELNDTIESISLYSDESTPSISFFSTPSSSFQSIPSISSQTLQAEITSTPMFDSEINLKKNENSLTTELNFLIAYQPINIESNQLINEKDQLKSIAHPLNQNICKENNFLEQKQQFNTLSSQQSDDVFFNDENFLVLLANLENEKNKSHQYVNRPTKRKFDDITNNLSSSNEKLEFILLNKRDRPANLIDEEN